MNKRILAALAVVVVGTGGAVWWYQGAVTRTHQHEPVAVRDAHGSVYYTCPMHPRVRLEQPGSCPICGMKLTRRDEQPVAPPTESAPQGARRVLYWYDPMRPDQHFEKPGKSPFMDMQLVPKYASGDERSAPGIVVEIDPRMVQNLGMRTAPARSGMLAQRVDAVGTVAVDERRILAVEARAPGWVERLDVRAVGETVQRGQALAGIYAPELLAAQEELALARSLGDESLISAARARLRLLGMESAGTAGPQRQVTISAPQAGVVTELLVRQGAQVSPGTPLMRLADLARVWILVEVPEAQAAGLAVGQTAEARLAGLPGRVFHGTLELVYPSLDIETRTLRARLAFDNADLALRPGMYANVSVSGGAPVQATLVPSEAVIRTGTRSVVLVAEAEGRYRPVEVTLGAERADETVVLEGLAPGQQVVVSGQFLIDSEASLLGAYNRMPDDSPAGRMRLMGEQGGPGAYGGEDRTGEER